MRLKLAYRTFILACRAFIQALKDPEKAKKFVEGSISLQRGDGTDPSHLRLLYYLQQSGRLIDFFKEDIESFSDIQVGAAVRKIHQDCAQVLEELVTIRPLKNEQEGSVVQIPKDYNPAEIKMVGKIKGEPPFTGILMHRGWKAQKRSLPKITDGQASEVICPAEIEVQS